MPEQPAHRPLTERPEPQQPEVHTLEIKKLTIVGEVVESDVAPQLQMRVPLAPALQAVQSWRRALASAGTPDTLLRAGAQENTWLDITHAHPSGLAQLLAGRPTRLSSLFREPGAHIRARRRARAIRAASAELATDRGIRGCYLAAGLATWATGVPDLAEPASADVPMNAPVLLRGCTLRPRGADDFDLDLDDTAVVNPELVRSLALAAGISIDGNQLGSLAFGQEGFDPRPVFEWLEDRCSRVPGFRITRSLVVATFTAGSGAVLADLDAVAVAVPRHDLLSAIAVPGERPPPADIAAPVRPLDRDPADELLVLDLDAAQQAAVDAVCGGEHVAVEGPPGSGVTQTLVAATGALVAAGRTVLVVSPRRSSTDAFLSRLETAGLRPLVLDLPDGAGGRRRALGEIGASLDALDREPDGDPDADRAALHFRLRRARELLAGTSRALHAVHEPWGVSAYTALDRLADLNARTRAPRGDAALSGRVLTRLDPEHRERLRIQLRAAAGAGAFNLTRVDTRWLDARVQTDREALLALQAARDARDGLLLARAAMADVCASVGMSPPQTVAECRPRLELLLGVRSTLDALLPAVYEQPLDGLIAAIAPGARRRSGDWSRQEWRQTRRRTVALVRPGVHVADLHARLVQARQDRVSWREMVGVTGAPRVPTGLSEAAAAVDGLVRSLAALGEVLAGTGTPDLEALPLDALEKRLLDLAADEAGIVGQPRRSTLLRKLREDGLGELVDNFRERRIGPQDVDAELDLAWWSGVLDAIVRADPVLAKHDAEAVRAARAQLRTADTEHVADGAVRVAKGVAARAREAVAAHPQQVQWLRAELLGENRSAWPGELFRRAGDVVRALRPIWVLSPDSAARALPAPDGAAAPPADAVIVDDAGNVGLPEVVAAIARARQVVVGGDRRRLHPPDGMPSLLDAVAGVTGVRRLGQNHRSRDHRLAEPLRECYPEGWAATPGVAGSGGLRLELVADGIGVPAPGEPIAVSPDAEVRRVVELIVQHAAERPRDSLLVVTFGERHAERIESALRSQAAYRTELSRWLAEHWLESCRGESFAVRSAQRALGLERDMVIVSVGLAKTPHGRVLHRFGSIDEPHGVAGMLSALSRARWETRLVCCFTTEDLADERLRSDGARLLHQVLSAAQAAMPLERSEESQAAEPAAEAGTDHGAAQPAPGGASLTGRAAVASSPSSDHDGGLVADLRDRLETAGLPVQPGPVDAGWPIDLVITDPVDSGRGRLAVDLDGTAYAGRGWRERDRQRIDRLERAGWAYCLVGGLDLHRDPAAEVDRVRQAWLSTLGDA